jgi:hypothetical protein
MKKDNEKVKKTENLIEVLEIGNIDISNSSYFDALLKIQEKKNKNKGREFGFKGFGIS